MAFELSSSARDKLAQKRAEYAASMFDKINRLNQLIIDWQSNPDFPSGGEEIKAMIHQLRGSAGLYGCNDLSSAAIECGDILAQSIAVSAEKSRLALEPVLKAMRRLTREQRTDNPREMPG